MKKITEPLKQYLKSHGCVFDFDRKMETLHFGIDGHNGRWRCMACADESGRFVLVSLIPLQAAEARHKACAELIVRINARLSLGRFDLDFNDGELRYITNVPLGEEDALSDEVIGDVIRGHHDIVDTFIPAIAAVLFASIPPEKAIAHGTKKSPESAEARFNLN
jgi:hypothetical protein